MSELSSRRSAAVVTNSRARVCHFKFELTAALPLQTLHDHKNLQKSRMPVINLCSDSDEDTTGCDSDAGVIFVDRKVYLQPNSPVLTHQRQQQLGPSEAKRRRYGYATGAAPAHRANGQLVAPPRPVNRKHSATQVEEVLEATAFEDVQIVQKTPASHIRYISYACHAKIHIRQRHSAYNIVEPLRQQPLCHGHEVVLPSHFHQRRQQSTSNRMCHSMNVPFMPALLAE